MIAHAERAHAKLSPSAAYRWMACPGSVRLSEGIENKSSIFADEGTAAHELASHCLDNGYSAGRFADWFVNLDAKTQRFAQSPDIMDEWVSTDRVFEITDEMVESVQMYIDYCRDHVDVGDEMDVEFRFDLQHVAKGMFGTGDCVIYKPKTGDLIVVDLKYGRGVAVDPKDNPQLLLYGLGAVARHGNRPLNSVTLTIVQPRCAGGGVKEWVTDPVTLLEFSIEIKDAAEKALLPDAPLNAGDWCKFCPASANCPVLHEKALAIAKMGFDQQPAAPQTLSADQLSDTLSELGIVEGWCASVRRYAHDEAMSGQNIPGWKLVEKRAFRKWKDEGGAVDWLKSNGAGVDDIFVKKMNSPAQMEKFAPGKNKEQRSAALAHLTTKQSSGAVLVPVSDKRPPISSGGSEFMQE